MEDRQSEGQSSTFPTDARGAYPPLLPLALTDYTPIQEELDAFCRVRVCHRRASLLVPS